MEGKIEEKNLEELCRHLFVQRIDIESEFSTKPGQPTDVKFYPRYMCKECSLTFVDRKNSYMATSNGLFIKKY